MKRLLRVVLVVVTPILGAALCTVGTPPAPEGTRVVIKGILGGLDMAQDILIVTPFATLTPTLTMTPTPTFTPTVEGRGDQGEGTSGGGDGDGDQDQTGGPGTGGSPTSVALVTLTPSPSPIVTPTPSATTSPTATASPSPSPSVTLTPSPTTTPIPTLTPTVPSDEDDDGDSGPPPPPPSPPVISFSSTVYNIGEGGGTAIITVVLDTAASQTVTVNFSSSNGSAFAPNDYTPTNGTLSFSAGQTSQTFTVPITQDNVDDPDVETVLLVLSGPANGTLGTSSATLQIIDDDPLPVLQFNTTITYTVFENVPPPGFVVTLDRPTGKGLTFTFEPEVPHTGTASVIGGDYIQIFNLDNFTPDITGVSPISKTITWVGGLQDDVIPEGPETLIMEIGSNPPAFTLGPNFKTTLTIFSDE